MRDGRLEGHTIVCAVPRTSPRACKAPPTAVVTRQRGRRVGYHGGDDLGSISEPACDACATDLVRVYSGDPAIHVEPLTDAWRARLCVDEDCESGAFAAEVGGACPDCLEQQADREAAGDEPRFSELTTREPLPEWAAWRSKDRTDVAPVDAYYAGWREAPRGFALTEQEAQDLLSAISHFRETYPREGAEETHAAMATLNRRLWAFVKPVNPTYYTTGHVAPKETP